MQVQFLLARRGKRERPLVEQWCVFFPLMLLDRFHSTNIKARLHIATLSLDRRCEGFSLFQIKAELKLGVVKLDRYTQNLVLEYRSMKFGDNACSTCLQPIFWADYE